MGCARHRGFGLSWINEWRERRQAAVKLTWACEAVHCFAVRRA